MTYREQRTAKAERLREWAFKRKTAAAVVFKTDEPFTSDIAFNTQPGHIPFRAKLIAHEDRAHESLKKAASMDAHANSIERQAAGAIYSDDHDALEALQAKIAKLEAKQAQMKAVNAAIRKHAKAGADAQTVALMALGLPESIARETLKPDFARRIGFPSYATTNNNANIRRLKGRITQLEREAVHGKPWHYYHAAKYVGTCIACEKPVEVGATIVYRDGEAKHFACCQPLQTEPATEVPK